MPKKKSARKKTTPKRKKTTAKKTVKAKASRAKASKPKAGKKPAKAKRSRPVAPKEPVLPWRQPLAGETLIGIVEDYYGHIGVVTFKLDAPLAVGDRIHVRGHTTDLTQPVESMQIAHQGVPQANTGDAVGIKANDKCRKGDYVYRLS